MTSLNQPYLHQASSPTLVVCRFNSSSTELTLSAGLLQLPFAPRYQREYQSGHSFRENASLARNASRKKGRDASPRVAFFVFNNHRAKKCEDLIAMQNKRKNQKNKQGPFRRAEISEKKMKEIEKVRERGGRRERDEWRVKGTNRRAGTRKGK